MVYQLVFFTAAHLPEKNQVLMGSNNYLYNNFLVEGYLLDYLDASDYGII